MNPRQITLKSGHSHAQKEAFEKAVPILLDSNKFDHAIAYLMLSELSKHVSPLFLSVYAYVEKHDAAIRTRELRHTFLREYQIGKAALNAVPADFRARYEPSLLNAQEPTFVQAEGQDAPTAIVFTTMFNNFYISNLVLAALLVQSGCSVLFLKDTSNFNFLKGISGLGGDWESSMRLLTSWVAGRAGPLSVVGFSSGGYAALLAATILKPDRCVGFSVRTDLSTGSALPTPPLMSIKDREEIPLNLRQSLTPLISESEFPFSLYAGNEDQVDIAHANAVSHLPNVSLRVFPNTAHISVRPLFLSHTLSEAICP
jgi:hypothetical protein